MEPLVEALALIYTRPLDSNQGALGLLLVIYIDNRNWND